METVFEIVLPTWYPGKESTVGVLTTSCPQYIFHENAQLKTKKIQFWVPRYVIIVWMVLASVKKTSATTNPRLFD
ncbi:hypothetical protein OUZ56_022882 [Daphnia magna]|uniref:Uncharacterized protein n=1 Tax=Daphnia magna TaxID=35525 RepID=A0ABR0AXV9_9CRUS|nr:hypothetical protein OUZ56_022882 [Daphnia magna]